MGSCWSAFRHSPPTKSVSGVIAREAYSPMTCWPVPLYGHIRPMIPFLKPRQAMAFALLVALVLLVGNARTSLWDQDEAAYAGFARTMLKDGDWVVPRFLWSEPHRKPPLLFWCIATSFRLLGESEFALRLP